MANCCSNYNPISLNSSLSSSSSRQSSRIFNSPSHLNFRCPHLPHDGQTFVSRFCSRKGMRRLAEQPLKPLPPSPRASSENMCNGGVDVAVEANAGQAKDVLLDLIRGEERGVRTQGNPKKLDEIVAAIETLASIGTDMVTTDDSLTAPWRMIWTTEKEILFLLEKAYLFGTKAGDVLQIIDVKSGTLNNAILFPPTGVFGVKATIKAATSQRMNFKFEGASLKVGRWKIPIPPFGKGWFESLYLDDEIRIAKDIRDNYLICDRSPSVPVL